MFGRVLVVLACLALAASLAGCGNTESRSRSTIGATASARPCRNLAAARKILVIRHAPAGSNVRFDFPSTVKINDPALVEELSALVCRLPAAGRGPYSCPADMDITYAIRFARDGRTSLDVVVQATGCQFVTGASEPRSAVTTPTFWTALGSAMGIQRATVATFHGTPHT
ncbi:hypothetical protein [Actinomadura napierensis]|uniref:Histidine phosphatase family protein n=1 Tax=Actinomadura napierensis TaxID=267854 RepID=A0ABN2YGE1_9ACTN